MAQQARWQRVKMIHVLGFEAHSILRAQSGVIRRRLAGQAIDSEIADDHLDAVFTLVQKTAYFDFIRRMPHGTRRLPIDIDGRSTGRAGAKSVHGRSLGVSHPRIRGKNAPALMC